MKYFLSFLLLSLAVNSFAKMTEEQCLNLSLAGKKAAVSLPGAGRNEIKDLVIGEFIFSETSYKDPQEDQYAYERSYFETTFDMDANNFDDFVEMNDDMFSRSSIKGFEAKAEEFKKLSEGVVRISHTSSMGGACHVYNQKENRLIFTIMDMNETKTNLKLEVMHRSYYEMRLTVEK